MFCPKCGNAVNDNARFCGSCGQVVDAPGAMPGATAAGGDPQNWVGSGMPSPGIVARVKGILLTPKAEWPRIAGEATSIVDLYKGYVVPLAGLASVMTFVRLSVIGVSTGFGGAFRTPYFSGLIYALVSFGFGLLGLFLVGLIVDALAPTFAGARDRRQAVKVAAYAFTPAWLSSVLGFLPAFGLLELAAGLYGIYLLYLGLPMVMRSPREKATGYTAAVVVCTIIMGILFGAFGAATGIMSRGRFAGMPGSMDATLSAEQRQERAAATVGNVLGGALGTDDKGKAGLTAAINNLAAAGQKMEQDQAVAAATLPSNAAAAASAADPQNAVVATAGLLTALGGAMAGSHPVDPVDFHALKDLLPAALPDMSRTDSQGNSQQAMGVKASSATAIYKGASSASAQIKIADLAGVAGLLDMANAVAQGQSSESDAGFEKSATIDGRTAHEKYDNGSRHGEINIIVAKRFGVDVVGDGVTMATLEQYASAVDFARLESLKGAEAPAH